MLIFGPEDVPVVDDAVGPKESAPYYDIVLAGLPEAARARWEDFMKMTTDSQWHSELFRELEARGKAQRAADDVLEVLAARSIRVPDGVRKQILACTDLAQLKTWLRSAATATTAADVIGA